MFVGKEVRGALITANTSIHSSKDSLDFEYNVSGWDRNDLKDLASVGSLQNLFSQDDSGRFLPLFSSMDKTPNFDGVLLIGNMSLSGTRIIPFAQFDVQIKTLPMPYVNENTQGRSSDFKYSCDTSSLGAVIKKVSKNPALLLLVDSTNERFFCKRLSISYCLSAISTPDQKTCTIYFNTDDEIVSLEDFFQKLSSINEEPGEESSDLLLADGLPSKLKEDLTKACIEMNRIMDNELRFIKTSLFPDVKQFGIACLSGNGSIITKIFMIKKNDAGELVRSFDLEPVEEGKARSIHDLLSVNDIQMKLGPATTFSAMERVGDFCQSQVERFCKKAFLPASCLSDEILREVIFFFLDSVAEKYAPLRVPDIIPAIYIKDCITRVELHRLWIAIRDAEMFELETTIENIFSRDEDPGTFILDPLKKSVHRNSDQRKTQWLDRALEAPFTNFNMTIVLQGKFPYKLVQSAINELHDRDIETVERLWRKSDKQNALSEWSEWNGKPQIYIGYTRSEYYHELSRLISYLQPAYRKAAKDLLVPELTDLVETGTYKFYADETSRDSSLSILHWPDGLFKTGYIASSPPEDPFQIGCDRCTKGISRLNFEAMPLYAALEYFLLKKLCKHYDVFCVMSLGETCGDKLNCDGF